VVNAAFDLFIELGANDEQAEFPVIYTDGLRGRSGHAPHHMHDSLKPLFEAIRECLPAPVVNRDAPPRLLVTTSMYDEYLGKIVTGRLERGVLRKGQAVARIARDGQVSPAKLTNLFVFNGLQREEVDEAEAGDIIALAGITNAGIGETIADAETPEPLPPITVEEPTVRMTFGVNTSPFAGREGTYVTSRKLRERLHAEQERDVAMRVADTDSPDSFLVSGRGELHLGILIETMRREGYEFHVSNPEVILHHEDGVTLEPFELVEIEVSDEYQGVVIELLGKRAGQMHDMRAEENGSVHYSYVVPTRGLLGFRQQFLSATRGQGIVTSLFLDYRPFGGDLDLRETGSLIASESGTATTYGIHAAQDRGQLFIVPGQDVYAGMIVGQHIRSNDLEVNVCRKKHLTNIRNNVGAENIRLEAARTLSLDDAIEYITEDELVEVTPKGWRLRKKLLSAEERNKQRKRRSIERMERAES
jgi:GTP-binding protein